MAEWDRGSASARSLAAPGSRLIDAVPRLLLAVEDVHNSSLGAKDNGCSGRKTIERIARSDRRDPGERANAQQMRHAINVTITGNKVNRLLAPARPPGGQRTTAISIRYRQAGENKKRNNGPEPCQFPHLAVPPLHAGRRNLSLPLDGELSLSCTLKCIQHKQRPTGKAPVAGASMECVLFRQPIEICWLFRGQPTDNG
jgi:hypothetical protein